MQNNLQECIVIQVRLIHNINITNRKKGQYGQKEEKKEEKAIAT